MQIIQVPVTFLCFTDYIHTTLLLLPQFVWKQETKCFKTRTGENNVQNLTNCFIQEAYETQKFEIIQKEYKQVNANKIS